MTLLLQQTLVRQDAPVERAVWVVGDSGARILGFVLWIVWLATVVGSIWSVVREITAWGLPGGALSEYTRYASAFWAAQPIYVAGDLHGFHYLPATLILATPLTWMSYPAAGITVGLVSAAALAASVWYLAAVFNPRHGLSLAGVILGLSSMAAATSFDLLQFQILILPE